METTIISFNWTGSIGLYRFYPALFHSIFSSSLSSLPPNFYVSHFCKPSHPPPLFSQFFFLSSFHSSYWESFIIGFHSPPLPGSSRCFFYFYHWTPRVLLHSDRNIVPGNPFFFCRKKSLNGVALSAYLTYVTLPWNKIMKGQFSCMPTVKSF